MLLGAHHRHFGRCVFIFFQFKNTLQSPLWFLCDLLFCPQVFEGRSSKLSSGNGTRYTLHDLSSFYFIDTCCMDQNKLYFDKFYHGHLKRIHSSLILLDGDIVPVNEADWLWCQLWNSLPKTVASKMGTYVPEGIQNIYWIYTTYNMLLK